VWNPLITICPSRAKPPLKLEGHWSRSQVRHRSTRWARWSQHWCKHLRARHLSERCMATLLTSPTCRCRAPLLGSQCLSFRRPTSVYIRHGGLSLTRVLIHTPIRGPAWILSLSIQTPVSGQHHCLRGSKTYSHHVRGASSMPSHIPLKFPYLHPYPFCHLTPLCARICRERVLPLSGTPLKTLAQNI